MFIISLFQRDSDRNEIPGGVRFCLWYPNFCVVLSVERLTHLQLDFKAFVERTRKGVWTSTFMFTRVLEKSRTS